MNVLADILVQRDLLANLIASNLKSRYKDSVFGFLWSILAAGKEGGHHDVIISD